MYIKESTYYSTVECSYMTVILGSLIGLRFSRLVHYQYFRGSLFIRKSSVPTDIESESLYSYGPIASCPCCKQVQRAKIMPLCNE